MGSIKNDALIRKKSLHIYQSEFSHIYRRKTVWELIRISMALMGIEFTYSALTAFVSPILLELGIKYNQMTLVWGISPVIGFFLSPVMGSLSDRCKLKLGRRRPFIILFSVFNVIGLLLIPFGNWLLQTVQVVFDKSAEENLGHAYTVASKTREWATIFTVTGIVLADYTSDALQHPSRAYLLDVCRIDDHARGLTTFTVLAGCGGFIGYLLGSINWQNVRIFGEAFQQSVFSGHVHVFFSMIAVLFSICIIVAITTFKEVPLKLVDYLRVDPDLAVEGGIYEKEFQEVTPLPYKQSTYGSVDKDRESSIHENSTPTFGTYLKSIIFMPYSLRMLCIVNLLCWMAHSSYTLYFTDFVGSVVYGGDPNAPYGSHSRTLYEDGVRFGCIGMALYSLSCMFYSFAGESLIKRFGLKRIFMCNILIDSVSLLMMAIFRDKILVLLLSVCCGVFYATLFTVPYILVAHYHSTNVFEIDSCGDTVPQRQVRGLGTDVAVIGSSVFIAQFALSLIIGFVTEYVASSTIVIFLGSFLALCAFLMSTKLMYLDL